MELRPRPLFVIEYYHDKSKKPVETIGFNGTQNPMTRTQLKLKMDELRRTTHKTGILVPVQTNRELSEEMKESLTRYAQGAQDIIAYKKALGIR